MIVAEMRLNLLEYQDRYPIFVDIEAMELLLFSADREYQPGMTGEFAQQFSNHKNGNISKERKEARAFNCQG